MSETSLSERLAANGLHLGDAEMAPFASIVAEVDRIAAWIRSRELSYADEPATCFAAPKGRVP